MSNENNSIKFIDGKVLFSKEIIEYFESIRTKENSEWIDKYFEVLNDESNLNAVKFNMHHIRPCFTFKNKNHRNRKETQKLGDAFNGNIIKLSLYNHLLAHYYLWKIYNEWNSKKAIQQMSFQKKYTNDLSEDEIKIIAKFREDCAKENQTKEEKRKYGEKWRKEHKNEILQRVNEWTENNEEKVKQNKSNWYQKNKYKILNKNKINREEKRIKEREYRYKNKDKIAKRNSRICYDPIKKEYCTWNALKHRKSRDNDKYKNIIISECLVKN